jgi:transposase, IS5 family
MPSTPSPEEELFAQAADQAAQTDPVLHELDGVLDTDPLYQQGCAQMERSKGAMLAGEVLARLLLVKYLYAWSDQQLAEQVADSLVLRWFCRLGFQPAPTASHVSQGAAQVPVATLEALANRVPHAKERASRSAGRLRPQQRARWR